MKDDGITIGLIERKGQQLIERGPQRDLMPIGHLFKSLHDDAARHERAHEMIDLVRDNLRYRPAVIRSLACLNPASHDQPVAHTNLIAKRFGQSAIRDHSD